MTSTGLLAQNALESDQAYVSTLGQRNYLASCRNKRFSTSANFEEKLSVRDLM